jgi:hypothetical protein
LHEAGHQDLDNIELDCQILFTENQGQALLVFDASPGSEGDEKVQLLSAIGTQQLGIELPEPPNHQELERPTAEAVCRVQSRRGLPHVY